MEHKAHIVQKTKNMIEKLYIYLYSTFHGSKPEKSVEGKANILYVFMNIPLYGRRAKNEWVLIEISWLPSWPVRY